MGGTNPTMFVADINNIIATIMPQYKELHVNLRKTITSVNNEHNAIQIARAKNKKK
jgi:hypothetical protein